jgi:hypothetical protein
MVACSIDGTLSDILMTRGDILIGATDLVNHTAPLAFNCTTNPSVVYFGILGFPGGNLTYYLAPGIIPIVYLSTTTPYPFKFIQPVCVFSLSITYSGTIDPGDSLTFSVYKNNFVTPLSATLTSVTPGTLDILNVGVTFTTLDVIDLRLTTVGSPNAGSFTGKILTY